MSPTRRALLASVGASLAIAGCVSDSGGSGASTAEPSTTEPTTDTTSEALFPGLNEPDPSHFIEVQNDADESRTVRVWVVRESTGEAVYDETQTFESNDATVVYNLKDANPDGIESFRICAELVESRGTRTETESETQAKAEAEAQTADGAETVTADGIETTATERKPIPGSRNCTGAKTNKCNGNFRVSVNEDEAFPSLISEC